MKYNLISYQKKIDEKYPLEHLKVLNYNGCEESCSIQCLDCGEIYINKAKIFTRSTKISICKKCHGVRRDTLEVQHKVEYLLKNSNLKVVIPFKNITTDMEFKCPLCNENFKRKPQVFLQTQKCPYCEAKAKRKPQSFFEQELKEKYGNEYKVLGQYNNAHEPILIEHQPCGFKWKVRPADLLRKAPCPRCKKTSRGEKTIEFFLKENNIEYIWQYRFKELPELSFDFFLPQFNLLIEFQGEQHYKAIPHFGGIDKFKRQQYNDNRKREYCKNHSFSLLEIKYTEINQISNILKKTLQLND